MECSLSGNADWEETGVVGACPNFDLVDVACCGSIRRGKKAVSWKQQQRPLSRKQKKTERSLTITGQLDNKMCGRAMSAVD